MGGTNSKQASRKNDDRPAIWVGYGKLLKLFREKARLTQEELAELISYSHETVASVEQGRRPAKAPFTAAAERVLEAGGALQVLQEEVDFAKLPAFFRDFALIEMEAVSRSSYDPQLVPGLLQTEDYARTVFEGRCPPLEEEVVEQHVDARLNRQRLLTRRPAVNFSFVIDEAALRNPLGNPQTMRHQLEHLLTQGQLRNVEMQVMPLGRGFHPGLNGPMVLIETAEHHHFGYFESQGIGHVVGDRAQVSSFSLRYGKLRSMALNLRESRAFIEQLAGEL
ncbi:helix-turn-helix transcriptional regulator [Streptomyces sp. WMMB 322]|uniref:helix-turn-helix domain-containing protein n=1 Tax=Streptomyces sp. WMMB 322 TaxID=1286821 RepID=UPI0006E40851|nr:helix-turn-helix transcriptional regulator [Streptomyces sp. WMMB 322]SCK36265.1 Helix-turn-helix domain-containing protein [Streptomyces sp. WMMB 322]